MTARFGLSEPDSCPEVVEPSAKAMLDALPTIAFVTGADGATLYANVRYQTYTGLPAKGLASGGWATLIHPEDREPVAASWSEALRSGEPVEVDYRLKAADGVHRWFQGRAAPQRTEEGEIRFWLGTLTDIDQLKTAEARAQERERQFSTLADGVPNLVWFAAPNGDVQYLNQRWYDYTGQSPEQALPHGWIRILHPDDSARTAAHWAEALSQGTSYEIETRYRRHDGAYRWFVARAEPVRDVDGAITGWFGTSTDIHDRKMADAALRESEARFRGVFASGVIGFTIFDAETGETLAINDRFLEMTGHTRADFEEGRWDWREFTLPEYLPLDEVAIAQVRETGRWEPFEKEYLRRDGTRFPVRLSAAALPGEPGRVVVAIEDITAQKASQAALRESEERFRNMAEHAPVMMWVTDAVGSATYFNRLWYEFTGQSEQDAQSSGWLEVLHPDDRDNVVREFEEATSCHSPLRVEYRLRRFDGAYRWAIDAAAPRFGPLREFLGYVGSVIDITERKEAEATLSQVNEMLEARVAQALEEREQVEAVLRQSQKMEAMGQLTGGVAHDFNNLLTPIVAVLDRLQRLGLGGERERRLIDGAAQSADRAKTLVQRLLAFARRQPLQATAVNMAVLVRSMADLVASTIGPQIRVVVDAPEDLPPAKADAHQLEMALLNLAVNARDAMPDGGTLRISVTAETLGKSNKVGLPSGPYLRLSVADTGVGMDEATLSRAVEPFFSTKGVGKGTGLGLSMAHGLASQLGGALTIQSRPRLGSNVELWLPQGGTAAEEVVRDQTPKRPQNGSGTVLLVDDDEAVRLSTADMLNELGYFVVEASSAEEASELLIEGSHVDLLVTDHLMPGMTGTNLARWVRARRPNLPVLIISGYAEGEGIEPDLPRLTKPFRKDELGASLAGLSLCTANSQ